MLKIAIGQFMQESHSFTPIDCSWEQFHAGHIYRGEEILTRMTGNRVEVAGAIDVAREQDLDIVPLLACNAVSSGYIRSDVFDDLLEDLLERLEAQLPVDGLFLALHGAMVAEGDEDASGSVLARARELVGAGTPIVATLDLHANVTAKMIAASDGLVGYHTCPHVDLYETGAAGMRLLLDVIRGEVEPVMGYCQLPLIAPPENSVTLEGPFRELMEIALAYESHPNVLNVSVFYVQPWLDLSDIGCSVVVVADGDQQLAEEIAEKIAEEFWRRRSRFYADLTPLEDAVRAAVSAPQGPVILADGADAPSGGAPGDSPAILSALIEAGVDVETLINIVDPAAVDNAIKAGLGNEASLRVGAWSSDLWEPAEITGRVLQVSDGAFRFTGPGYRGREFHRGRTVVLQSGAIFLQIMERPVFQGDLALYTSLGLDPREARIVVVKTPSAFRVDYEPFAAQIMLVDAPGPTSSNLKSFNWRKLPRPFYPFDEIDDWRRS